MLALLLGGTGAMGSSLAEILFDQGIDVYVTTRRSPNIFNSKRNVHYIQGNAHDNVFLKGIIDKYKFDAIVDFMTYSPQNFENRMKFLLSSAGQYVFLSSSRVYANSDTPITESSPRLLDVCTDKEYLSTQEYALAKARCEDMLRGSGMDNWTIIRPYITYNTKRLQLGVMEKESWLYRALKGRDIVFSQDIDQRFTTLTYGYDVARGIAAIIGNKNAYGEAFHITCSDKIRWHDVAMLYVDTIEEFIGKRPNIVYTDSAINLGIPQKKWQVKVDRLYDRVFDNSKISKFIDTTTFIAPTDGLKKCLRTFLVSPEFLSINQTENILLDKLSGTYTSLKELGSRKVYLRYLIKRFVYPISKLS